MLLSNGLTAVADMGTSADDWAAMRRAGDSGPLNVRDHELCRRASGDARDQRRQAGRRWLYGDRLRMGGVKLYADGALGSRGAWLKAPYPTSRDTRGLRLIDDAELRDR